MRTFKEYFEDALEAERAKMQNTVKHEECNRVSEIPIIVPSPIQVYLELSHKCINQDETCTDPGKCFICSRYKPSRYRL